MNHRNIDIYTCEHCGQEFYSEAECREHEETHTLNFENATPEELAEELDTLGDYAYSYRIGDSVMGMTVKSYSNLMSAAAGCLRKGADNAGKE